MIAPRPFLPGLPAKCDVAVVGAGLAGAAAGLFAARAGHETVQVGPMGGVLFASGLFDLLVVHPVASPHATGDAAPPVLPESRVWDDPWAALAALRRDEPRHPLARVSDADLRAAFGAMIAALDGVGLDYAPPDGANVLVPTAMGTVRYAFCVPRTMAAAARGLAEGAPGLVVGFDGVREFSARQVVTALAERWPGLRAVRLTFPGFEGRTETYLAHMARALEVEETRARLVDAITPHLADARVVGLPAVLGLRRARAVHADLEARLGRPVFELPTLPTSVPGLRLGAGLEAALAAAGVQRLVQWRALAVTPVEDGLDVGVGREVVEHTIRARAVVLATGRFAGRGLVADRAQVREALLDLPVHQPPGRADWHRPTFLDPSGHAVNRAGLPVDDRFRPLDAAGAPAHERLFAVGTILAHQDWVRSKSGAGLAFGTAWAAVQAASAALRGEG